MKYSEKVIAAFVMHEKPSEIMKETGLSARTIYKYRQDPELQKIVQKRREELIAEAVANMQGYLSDGVKDLLKIIRGKETPPQTKVNAIQLLFNQCREWTLITDVQKRLEALENAENSRNLP